MGMPPAPGTWRGLVVAPELRCSDYEPEQYRHPPGLEDAVFAALGDKLYEAYTGVYYDHVRDIQVDHIVAKREAHDSGGCAWAPSLRREFARDLDNLALASPTLDLGIKAGNDAAEWLPDFNRCWYAGAVVAVRRKYDADGGRGRARCPGGSTLGLRIDGTGLRPRNMDGGSDHLGRRERLAGAVAPTNRTSTELGVAGNMAAFCTSTSASVDFAFVAGGARLEQSEAKTTSPGVWATRSRVNIEWSTPPPQTSWTRITVDQYPHWENWTARLSPDVS